MSSALILKEFSNTSIVNGAGGLSASAGKFSRSAVVAAFQLNGGLEAFANWAKENQTDFYCRMFGKIIGTEPLDPAGGSDDVEELLNTIDDIEFEDITEETETRATLSEMRVNLAEMATVYSESENEEA